MHDDMREAIRKIATAKPDRAGKILYRHIIAVEGGGRNRREKTIAKWPIHSEACAVHPSQRQELMDFLASKGVPTEVDEHGCPVYTSAKHRKKACEARGFFDRNGGYGDPQRQTTPQSKEERAEEVLRDLVDMMFD